MYTIYKITNIIDGKAYIGFDSNWPSRKSVHICEAITRKNKKYPLYHAMRKYGIENFKWEIIYQSEDKHHTLNVMENKYIIEHNTYIRNGHGYNMTLGGEGTYGWIPSKETRKKIGLANSRCTLTNEGRKAKSEYSKNNNPMHNVTIREKHRKIMAKLKPGAKKVTDGNRVFDSIRDAQAYYSNIKYNTLWCWIKNNKNGWNYI